MATGTFYNYTTFNDAPELSKSSVGSLDSNGYGQLVYPKDLFDNRKNYGNAYTAYFISFKDDPYLIGDEYSDTESNVLGSYKKLGSDAAKTIASLSANEKSANKRKIINERLTNTIVGGASGLFIGSLVGSVDASALGIKGAALKAGGEVLGGGVFGAATANVNQNNGWIEITNERKTQKACICLPTPMIVANYEINWSEESNKLLGGLLAGGADFVNKFDWKKIFSGTSGVVGSAVNSIGSGIVAGALSTPVFGTALGIMSREAANPRKEQLFKDVGMREFNISYIFAPTSEQEAKNVESIIQQFKYHAHPSYRKGDVATPGINSNLLNYPSEFDIIHYHDNKRNTHLPKHTTSVLKRVSVDYSNGNDNYTFFENGMPTVIKMDLTFAEIAMLTKEDIAEGY